MKVWDDMIIDSALATYYNSSLSLMIQALQAKLKVQYSYVLYSVSASYYHVQDNFNSH